MYTVCFIALLVLFIAYCINAKDAYSREKDKQRKALRNMRIIFFLVKLIVFFIEIKLLIEFRIVALIIIGIIASVLLFFLFLLRDMAPTYDTP